jgi:hypothetical protein
MVLNQLKEQKDMKLKVGIYHRTQIDLTNNSKRREKKLSGSYFLSFRLFLKLKYGL